MDTLAILVAAGRGERMGAGSPKAFLVLAREPLLLRSGRALAAAPSVERLVAVVPAGLEQRAREMLAELGKRVDVVPGGARRQDSVLAGLKRAPESFRGMVAVHDAARPLLETALVETVLATARRTGAALPVLPVTDTVKQVETGRIVATLERSGLAAAQTPQAFRFELLVRAYEDAFRERVDLTDEAMAVERLGEAVATVPGSPRNRKLTTPEDLVWAESVLAREGVSA